MTRATLQRKLRKIYVGLALVLVAALAAKLLALFPLPEALLRGFGVDNQVKLADGIYDFLKDMAVVFVTIAAAYLASMLQRRSNFVESLEEEWRRIVNAKAKLITYCDHPKPTEDQYLEVCQELSRTIDTMRIAYKNVGETEELVGLYPFAPLHNMRRAMQTISPFSSTPPTAAERKLVGEMVNMSFAAIRENFLEELDLEEPTTPVLRSASRRLKKVGRTREAGTLADHQGVALDRLPPLKPELAALQARLDHMREIEDGRAVAAESPR